MKTDWTIGWAVLIGGAMLLLTIIKLLMDTVPASARSSLAVGSAILDVILVLLGATVLLGALGLKRMSDKMCALDAQVSGATGEYKTLGAAINNVAHGQAASLVNGAMINHINRDHDDEARKRGWS